MGDFSEKTSVALTLFRMRREDPRQLRAEITRLPSDIEPAFAALFAEDQARYLLALPQGKLDEVERREALPEGRASRGVRVKGRWAGPAHGSLRSPL